MVKMSTTAQGTKFEEKVSSLFGLMGYNTELNKSINGCQIDIYGELTIGPTIYKSIIECKDYSEKIGVKVVQNFLGVFGPAKDVVDKAFIVSRKGFTRDAKLLGLKANIECHSYNDIVALSRNLVMERKR